MSDRQSKDFHMSYHQSCASEYQCRSHLCVSKDIGEAQEENPIDYSDRRQNIVDLEIQKKPKSLRRRVAEARRDYTTGAAFLRSGGARCSLPGTPLAPGWGSKITGSVHWQQQVYAMRFAAAATRAGRAEVSRVAGTAAELAQGLLYSGGRREVRKPVESIGR